VYDLLSCLYHPSKFEPESVKPKAEAVVSVVASRRKAKLTDPKRADDVPAKRLSDTVEEAVLRMEYGE
jgi:hypothetical protein